MISLKPPLWLIIITPALLMLACAVGGKSTAPGERVVRLTHLPTLTPTSTVSPTPLPEAGASLAGAAPPLAENPAPGDGAASLTPLPTSTPTSPLSSTPLPEAGASLAGAAPPLAENPAPGEGVAGLTPLPTSTPTSTPNSTPLPEAGENLAGATPPVAENPTPVVEATPTRADNPASNFTSETPGWTVSGGRIYDNQNENNLLLFGELSNDTGSVQEVTRVTGAVFDAQGQLIANIEDAAYVPVQYIPAGSRVPFELIAPGRPSVSHVALKIEAQPSGETPGQGFEFADLQQRNESNSYCLGGTYRRQDGESQKYLVIVLILYNQQDNVINFADYYADSSYMVSGQAGEFEVCADTLSQDIARHELRAWGE